MSANFDTQIGNVITDYLYEWNNIDNQIIIYSDKWNYMPWINMYHEHILTTWSSDWSSTSALRCLSEGKLKNKIVYISPDTDLKSYNTENTSNHMGFLIINNENRSLHYKSLNLNPAVVIRYNDFWPRPEIKDVEIIFTHNRQNPPG